MIGEQKHIEVNRKNIADLINIIYNIDNLNHCQVIINIESNKYSRIISSRATHNYTKFIDENKFEIEDDYLVSDLINAIKFGVDVSYVIKTSVDRRKDLTWLYNNLRSKNIDQFVVIEYDLLTGERIIQHKFIYDKDKNLWTLTTKNLINKYEEIPKDIKLDEVIIHIQDNYSYEFINGTMDIFLLYN